MQRLRIATLPFVFLAGLAHAATEKGLAPLETIRSLAVPPTPAAIYYVSSQAGGDLPAGDDANPGTAALPIRTLDALRVTANAAPCPVEIVVDGGDVWSGADFGEGLHHLSPSCDDPDEIGIYIHSTHPAKRYVLDGAEATPGYCDGTGTGSGAITAGGIGAPDGGWVVIANFLLRNCDDDGLDTSHEGRLVAFDFRCENIYGGGNQCATPHSSTRMLLFNFEMEGGDDSGEYSAGMQPAGESVFIAMFGTVRWGGMGAPFVGPNSTTQSLLYRVELERGPPFINPSNDVISSSDPGDGGQSSVTFLVGRVSAPATQYDALQAFNTGTGKTKTYRFFRTTFEGARRLINLNPAGDDTTISFFDRCGRYDDYASEILAIFGEPSRIDVNIGNAGYDETASTPFRLTDDSGQSIYYSTLVDAAQGVGAVWINLFAASTRPSGDRRCVYSWSEKMPKFGPKAESRVAGERVCLPSFLTGKKICSVELNLVGDQTVGF